MLVLRSRPLRLCFWYSSSSGKARAGTDDPSRGPEVLLGTLQSIYLVGLEDGLEHIERPQRSLSGASDNLSTSRDDVTGRRHRN